MASVTNQAVREFWERNPVAAAAIGAEPGTAAFFAEFDRLREADDCEPYAFSNRLHGYETARGKRVLDVGCGNGYVLSRYARYGAEVCGVDLTETALVLSRRRFELEGLKGEFQRTNGDVVPYPDGHFDIVCSMGVLHHIEDPRPMLAEIRRVLRPGGACILMLYHRNSWKYRVVLPLLCLLHPRYRGKTLQQALNMNDGADCPLAKVYSRSEVRSLLEGFAKIDFSVNQLGWRQFFMLPSLVRLLAPLLPASSEGFLARHLGWNLYVRAE
jgi:SAM-dependent methyltransferase